MTQKSTWLLLLTLVVTACWSATPSYADSCTAEDNKVKDDGSCWRSLKPIEKMAIVRGIWVGGDTKAITDTWTGGSLIVARWEKDWLATPESTTIGDIVEYFDKLYETPANRSIDWRNAYILAALNARDDDENDRLSLLSFFRSHQFLPTRGTLLGSAGGNRVKIRSGDETYEIAISGVVVPADVENMTAKVINSLSSTTFFGESCEKASPTDVTLVYQPQTFDQDKHLTASIRISTYQVPCVNGGSVPIVTSAGQSFTNLGYFLLVHGLGKVDERVDSKWTKEQRDMLFFANSPGIEDAKKAGIYVYGTSTDPVVEALLGN